MILQTGMHKMHTNKIIKDIKLKLGKNIKRNRHTTLFKHLPDMVMTRFYHVPCF